MKLLYVIYDRTAEEAGPLFEAPNDGVALRNYRNVMDKVPGYQRADYRLYKLGSLDEHTMAMTVVVAPEEIIFDQGVE